MSAKLERLTKSKQRISDLLFTATIEASRKQMLVDELKFLERALQDLIDAEIARPKLVPIVLETKKGEGK